MQKNMKNKIINPYVYNHQILTFYMIALRVFFSNKICQVQLTIVPLILVPSPFPQIFLLICYLLFSCICCDTFFRYVSILFK